MQFHKCKAGEVRCNTEDQGALYHTVEQTALVQLLYGEYNLNLIPSYCWILSCLLNAVIGPQSSVLALTAFWSSFTKTVSRPGRASSNLMDLVKAVVEISSCLNCLLTSVEDNWYSEVRLWDAYLFSCLLCGLPCFQAIVPNAERSSACPHRAAHSSLKCCQTLLLSSNKIINVMQMVQIQMCYWRGKWVIWTTAVTGSKKLFSLEL